MHATPTLKIGELPVLDPRSESNSSDFWRRRRSFRSFSRLRISLNSASSSSFSVIIDLLKLPIVTYTNPKPSNPLPNLQIPTQNLSFTPENLRAQSIRRRSSSRIRNQQPQIANPAPDAPRLSSNHPAFQIRIPLRDNLRKYKNKNLI